MTDPTPSRSSRGIYVLTRRGAQPVTVPPPVRDRYGVHLVCNWQGCTEAAVVRCRDHMLVGVMGPYPVQYAWCAQHAVRRELRGTGYVYYGCAAPHADDTPAEGGEA